jgi:hypothetical protein
MWQLTLTNVARVIHMIVDAGMPIMWLLRLPNMASVMAIHGSWAAKMVQLHQ